LKEKIVTYQLRVDQETGKPYKGVLKEIENTIKAEQAYVGGRIQVMHLTDEIDVICNEESKIMGLPINRSWLYENEVLDIISGNILCVRHEGEEFVSIEKEDIPIILKYLKPIVRVEEHLVIVPEDMCVEYKETGR